MKVAQSIKKMNLRHAVITSVDRDDLEDYGRVESMPVLEGKRMTIMIAPKKAATPAPKKGAKEEASEDASDED